jgi:hypothetical protein
MVHTTTLRIDISSDKELMDAPVDQISQAFDQELNEFDQILVRSGTHPLVRSERSIIKTFLAYKFGLKLQKE